MAKLFMKSRRDDARQASLALRAPWIAAVVTQVLASAYVGAHYAGLPVPWPWSASVTGVRAAEKAGAKHVAAEQHQKNADEEAAHRAPQVGQTFRDCPDVCPDMVVIPTNTAGRKASIPQPIAVGKFEVTFSEWDACVAAGACADFPDDKGWGRGQQPVIHVSWEDVTNEYLSWLTKKTGKTYRLLTMAEWEYAARAGSTTNYFWGDEIGTGNANCYGCGSQWDGKQTAPVGSFKPNAFGLYDMHGNVWEWCEDTVKTSSDTASRALRGGSYNFGSNTLRSDHIGFLAPGGNGTFIGFRVARTL